MKNTIYFMALLSLFQSQAFTADIEVSNEICSLSNEVVRRVAFDIGSGQIKMQVSDVDLTVNKFASVLLTDSVKVALREDLAKNLDGRFSDEIQNKMVDAISQLIKKASPFNPAEYHAIATESLRLAKNANSLVERIQKETGLPVTIVSQEEEGILGFISAISKTDIDSDKAVSWDFGGGSFQITAKFGNHYSVYQGKLGQVPFKNALLKIQGKDVENVLTQTLSPNPITKTQVVQALQFIKDNIKDFPIELCQKLKQPDVVVLGIGINPLWNMQKNENYNKYRVLEEIEQRLNLDDDALMKKDAIDPESKQTTAYLVTNLIVAYGIMDALEIIQVKYVGTQGANSKGALLSPKYWKIHETNQNPK